MSIIMSELMLDDSKKDILNKLYLKDNNGKFVNLKYNFLGAEKNYIGMTELEASYDMDFGIVREWASKFLLETEIDEISNCLNNVEGNYSKFIEQIIKNVVNNDNHIR